jgi:hypothetical protein
MPMAAAAEMSEAQSDCAYEYEFWTCAEIFQARKSERIAWTYHEVGKYFLRVRRMGNGESDQYNRRQMHAAWVANVCLPMRGEGEGKGGAMRIARQILSD